VFGHRKILAKIEGIEGRLDYEANLYRDRYYKLLGDFDRLVEALKLTRQETHKVEYVRKGGPEKP
jgi:hypothetical protein